MDTATAPNLPSHSLEKFSRYIVTHAVYSNALRTIERAIRASQSSGQPYSALLTGDAGTGKTTVCRHLIQQRPVKPQEVDLEGVRKIVPAFYCSVPAEVTVKGLATVMLKRLGSSNLSGDKTVLTERLCDLLKTCKTEVIFLDEFHHLLRSNASKVLDGVRDWIKGLMNETRVTVIIVGLPKCASIIDEDDQTARRLPYRAHLSYFVYSTEANSQYILLLKALANAIQQHANIKLAPTLTDADKATAIYAATGGSMNSIRQLLHEVCDLAHARKDRRITWGDFATAFDQIKLSRCLVKGKNPFKMKVDTLERVILGAKAA